MMLVRVFDVLIRCALVTLVAVLAIQAVSVRNVATAWHKNGTLHMNSIHSSATHEDTCVTVWNNSMTFTTARDRVKGTLYLHNTASDWDDLAGSRVYFIVNSSDCANLSSAVYQGTEMEYRVVSDATAESQCGTINGKAVSCAWLGIPKQSASHWDYQYGYAMLQASRLSGTTTTYHHLVNHETGHPLGLADPGTGDSHYQCMYSVMHSMAYDCSSSLEWPSNSDRTSVESIANNP